MTRAQRLRRQLWHAQGGLCAWCKRQTQLVEGEHNGKRTSGLAATIDHLYSRLDERRYTQRQRHVMACSTCNGRRSKLECIDVARNGELTRDMTKFEPRWLAYPTPKTR